MEVQIRKQHVCPREGCTSAFDRPYRLAQHLLVHDNIKAFACPVENCNKSYTNKSHLDRHFNTVHEINPIEMLYSCQHCWKTFSNRQNLKRHMKVIHTRPSFICPLCNIDCKKKNLLSAHMYRHTGIKAFNCDMCTDQFVTLYEKKRHMRFHKIYKCEDCQIEFNHWSKYQKHKKTDHINNQYICDVCGRCFKQRGHIVRHVKTHTQGPKPKIFLCPVRDCNRTYTRNSNLKQHILVKHQNYAFACELCEISMSSQAKLNSHVKRVHGRKKKEKKRKVDPNKLRKQRKDKGSFKVDFAKKLAGLPMEQELHEDGEVECEDSSINYHVKVEVEKVNGDTSTNSTPHEEQEEKYFFIVDPKDGENQEEVITVIEVLEEDDSNVHEKTEMTQGSVNITKKDENKNEDIIDIKDKELVHKIDAGDGKEEQFVDINVSAKFVELAV